MHVRPPATRCCIAFMLQLRAVADMIQPTTARCSTRAAKRFTTPASPPACKRIRNRFRLTCDKHVTLQRAPDTTPRSPAFSQPVSTTSSSASWTSRRCPNLVHRRGYIAVSFACLCLSACCRRPWCPCGRARRRRLPSASRLSEARRDCCATPPPCITSCPLPPPPSPPAALKV
jgi:hypothetical protein